MKHSMRGRGVTAKMGGRAAAPKGVKGSMRPKQPPPSPRKANPLEKKGKM